MNPGEFSHAVQHLTPADWRALDARAIVLEQVGVTDIASGDDSDSGDTPAVNAAARISTYGAAVAAKDAALSALWVQLLPRLEPLWAFVNLHRHTGPGAALVRNAGEALVLGEALAPEHKGVLLGAVEEQIARHGTD